MTQGWGRLVVAGTAASVVFALAGCGSAQPQAKPDRAVLAGSADSPSPTPSKSDSDPQVDPGPQIDPGPPGGTPAPTPVGGRPWDSAASAACARALADRGTSGLVEVAQTQDRAGVRSFWAAERRWVLCDVATGVQKPALLPSGRADDGPFGEQSHQLVSTRIPRPGGDAVRYTAGGLLPYPVYEIEYSFPDGHREEARYVASDERPDEVWWSVSYTATDGVLVDPEADPAGIDPLNVEVVGGPAVAFMLPWDKVLQTS